MSEVKQQTPSVLESLPTFHLPTVRPSSSETPGKDLRTEEEGGTSTHPVSDESPKVESRPSQGVPVHRFVRTSGTRDSESIRVVSNY